MVNEQEKEINEEFLPDFVLNQVIKKIFFSNKNNFFCTGLKRVR
jgi:hypothetical protein